MEVIHSDMSKTLVKFPRQRKSLLSISYPETESFIRNKKKPTTSP
jgi:hypothetical protein